MKKTDVLEHFGNQYEVARVLTEAGYPCSQPAVSKWPDAIPPLRAFQIEKITQGKLKAEPESHQAA